MAGVYQRIECTRLVIPRFLGFPWKVSGDLKGIVRLKRRDVETGFLRSTEVEGSEGRSRGGESLL